MQRALAILAVLAAAIAGCTSSPQPQEPLDDTGLVDDLGSAANNTTIQYKPPVARMQVFDVDGALVYESNFVAENVTAPAPVQGGGPVTFLASLSEAVDKTASLARWDWDFGDGSTASGRGVSHAFRDTGGVFRVTLTVVDTHGLADQQTVTLGALATRTFNETLAFAGSLQAGSLGNVNQDGVDTMRHALELASEVEGFPVVVESLSLTLTPNEPTSDFDLYLLDAEGEELASSASGPAPGGTESIELGEGEVGAGAYTVLVRLYAGANGSYAVAGEVLYRVVNPQVEEMFGEHAH